MKLRGNSVDDKVRYARRDLHCETKHHAKHIVDDGPDEDSQILGSLLPVCQLAVFIYSSWQCYSQIRDSAAVRH